MGRWARAGAALGLWMAAIVGCSGGAPAPVYAVADRGGDRDGDGAADIDDACPDEPEDGLPPKANDGCPADDPDLDGIGRANDRCPDAKEDGLEPNAYDGCPSLDTDGDGVADAVDACPDALEDNLPPHPSDGCPAADRDRDGIVDALDRCPDEPETINGYRDDDGCPDTAGADVAYDERGHRIFVPEGLKIEFEADSSDLTPAAASAIDQVAAVLKAHPEIERLEIEGHASTLGDASYNVALTERRSAAVAQALAARGVEARRLVVIGYGEYCPAVETDDEVDEPKNRRVELKTVVVRGVWQEVPRGCWRAQTHGINPTQRRPGHFQPTAPAPRGAGGA